LVYTGTRCEQRPGRKFISMHVRSKFYILVNTLCDSNPGICKQGGTYVLMIERNSFVLLS
jgi:hypothetical protein